MTHLIFTYDAVRSAGWRLPVFLDWLLGGFDSRVLTQRLGATPGSWLRLRWHQYGGVLDQLALLMVRCLLLSMVCSSWPSLVHVRLVFLVSCDDGRDGALHRG